LTAHLVAIAAGGSVGALLRYWVSTGVHGLLGRGFPWGTLTVNVLGSAVMGFLSIWLIERLDVSPEWRAALMIGLLGSFTTFSTFSVETLGLLEQGELTRAFLNVFVSVVTCLLAAWAGMLIGRTL